MSAHISDIELIEKFLRGELLENEQLIFEQRKEEEAFMVLLEETIIAYKGRLTLKQQLKDISEELKAEKPVASPRKQLFWISGIAASLLLFFGIYFLNNSPLSADELFDSYFEIYPNAYTIKGNAGDKTHSKKAFDFYDTAQYTLAVATFEKISSERKLTSSEHFYYGISLLSIDKPQKAKNQFKKVVSTHPLSNEARWYTALSLIKQDSTAKAKIMLNNTKSQFSTRRKKTVQKLLDELP